MTAEHLNQSENCFDKPIFGSMRFGSISENECVDLLSFIIDNGGRRFHSSSEYDTFELFCKSLHTACKATNTDPTTLHHIVKLATPHFGEYRFDANKLASEVDMYRNSLMCNEIETIQWMVRADLKNEDSRIQCLEDQGSEISDTVAALKTSGKISRFGNFPYTSSFRDRVLQETWCDVILDYYNPAENTDLDFTSFRDNQRFIAIRPLYPVLTNETKTHWTVPQLLDFALKPDPVESSIVSVSSATHAKQLMDHYSLRSDHHSQ